MKRLELITTEFYIEEMQANTCKSPYVKPEGFTYRPSFMSYYNEVVEKDYRLTCKQISDIYYYTGMVFVFSLLAGNAFNFEFALIYPINQKGQTKMKKSWHLRATERFHYMKLRLNHEVFFTFYKSLDYRFYVNEAKMKETLYLKKSSTWNLFTERINNFDMRMPKFKKFKSYDTEIN